MSDVCTAGTTCFAKRREAPPDLLAEAARYSPPEGFRSPLPIAIVELPRGRARPFSHGEETRAVKVVAHVSIEQGDSIFSVSHIGAASRARRCRRRAGHRGERMAAIGKSPVKGFWKGRDRGER